MNDHTIYDVNAYVDNATAQLRADLADHDLYRALTTPARVAAFMEAHVWAVWDFMSIVKALQRAITCVDVPWVPSGYPHHLVRYVNDIVRGEESDDHLVDGYTSHFELYLDAMSDADARTANLHQFVEHIREGGTVALGLVNFAPAHVHTFVATTFDLLHRNELPAIAAMFAYGRETIIPSMFDAVLRGDNQGVGPATRWSKYPALRYYLQRHIDLDGDEHGPMARNLVATCCRNDRDVSIAAAAASTALVARRQLWDATLAALPAA